MKNLFNPILLPMVLFMFFGTTACNIPITQLTQKESKMPEAKYYNSEFSDMPQDVSDAIANGPICTEEATAFKDRLDLLEVSDQKAENGYCLLEDGTCYSAIRTKFPEANGEMIYWWFWWHVFKDIRYKIWCPGAHYSIDITDKDQVNDESLSYSERIFNNPHLPVEDVGSGVMQLSIRFVPPETFGFTPSMLKEANVEAILCSIVGNNIAGVYVNHSYMIHIFQREGEELVLRSRFWLGSILSQVSPFITKMIFTEQMGLDQVLHCSEEYNHLAEFLPEIYEEFGPK